MFKKQKMSEDEIEKTEEKVKEDIEKDKEEIESLEAEGEEVSWKVGSIATQTEPVLIYKNQTYNLYQALAELLNRTETD